MDSANSPANAPLAIKVDREGDEIRITPAGELDLSNAEDLRELLDETRSSGAARVIVDLGRLEFIDSTGLRVLLRAAVASNEEPDRLLFKKGTGQVDRLMKLAGVDDEFRFVD